MNNEIKLAVAHKYAKAFFNIFKDKIDLQDIEKLYSLKNFFIKNTNLFVYFNLSLIDNSVKKEVFNKSLDLFALNNIYLNLVDLLLKENSFSLITYILGEIIRIYKNNNNIMEFNVITSDKLSNDRLNLIKEFLKHKTNKKIIIREKIDKSLIAGLKIYNDEFEWQHSVRHDLNMIKNVEYLK